MVFPLHYAATNGVNKGVVSKLTRSKSVSSLVSSQSTRPGISRAPNTMARPVSSTALNRTSKSTPELHPTCIWSIFLTVSQQTAPPPAPILPNVWTPLPMLADPQLSKVEFEQFPCTKGNNYVKFPIIQVNLQHWKAE